MNDPPSRATCTLMSRKGTPAGSRNTYGSSRPASTPPHQWTSTGVNATSALAAMAAPMQFAPPARDAEKYMT